MEEIRDINGTYLNKLTEEGLTRINKLKKIELSQSYDSLITKLADSARHGSNEVLIPISNFNRIQIDVAKLVMTNKLGIKVQFVKKNIMYVGYKVVGISYTW